MILAVVQARCGSTRLPRKVLAPLAGRALIVRLLERVAHSQEVDELVVATTVLPGDDELAAMVEGEGYAVRRGPIEDVLARFLSVIDEFEPDDVVRLTGDNPFVDAATVDLVVRAHRAGGHDYTTNGLSRTFPHGMNVEVIRTSALRRLASGDLTAGEREHVTLGILQRADEFTLGHVSQPVDRSSLRWTVDLPEDLAWAQEVYAQLHPLNPEFGQEDVVELIDAFPELRRTMDAAR